MADSGSQMFGGDPLFNLANLNGYTAVGPLDTSGGDQIPVTPTGSLFQPITGDSTFALLNPNLNPTNDITGTGVGSTGPVFQATPVQSANDAGITQGVLNAGPGILAGLSQLTLAAQGKGFLNAGNAIGSGSGAAVVSTSVPASATSAASSLASLNLAAFAPFLVIGAIIVVIIMVAK